MPDEVHRHVDIRRISLPVGIVAGLVAVVGSAALMWGNVSAHTHDRIVHLDTKEVAEKGGPVMRIQLAELERKIDKLDQAMVDVKDRMYRMTFRCRRTASGMDCKTGEP